MKTNNSHYQFCVGNVRDFKVMTQNEMPGPEILLFRVFGLRPWGKQYKVRA